MTVTLAAWPGGRVVVVRSAREAELARLAHRDALTGLLNRRAFTARLHEEAAFGRRSA